MDNEKTEVPSQTEEQAVAQTSENFEIPEGTEVIGEKVLCSKHGDVTGSLTKLQYLKVEENENHEKSIQPYTAIFCTQCICDLLFELQDQGKIGSLTREKQVATHEQAAKIRAYYGEKIKELQKKSEDTNTSTKAEVESNKETSDENKTE